MPLKTQPDIPQVLSIVRVFSAGAFNVKKAVRQALGLQGRTIYLQDDEASGELRLSARAAAGTPLPLTGRNRRVQLPAPARHKLGPDLSHVALVQRDDALAVKRFEIAEVAADRARVVDVETPHALVRRAETRPLPEALLPRLEARAQELIPRHSVRRFLVGRPSLPAWRARRMLGAVGTDDGTVQDRLIAERLDAQDADGAWGGEVVRTARMLHDLAALGLDANDAPVKKGVLWLLERPQSPESPGMFFLDDGLVARQVEVVAERRRFDREGRRGSKPRFRERRTSEITRARVGDDTAHAPCGPRLMWPNAFALEALLRLGYEAHPRVQAALDAVRHAGWCECAYQHGVADWGEPPTLEEIAAREARFRAQFRYGGLEGTEDLDKRDLTQTVGDKMPRVAHEIEDGADLYPLRMPTHQQPCELITVKALRYVLDPALRRLAEAYLWRFAARQHGPKGHFGDAAYRHVGPHFYLNLFSGYDTPVARVALLRALPWIVAEQNPDGSWGADGHQDAATLAVVRALVALGRGLR